MTTAPNERKLGKHRRLVTEQTEAELEVVGHRPPLTSLRGFSGRVGRLKVPSPMPWSVLCLLLIYWDFISLYCPCKGYKLTPLASMKHLKTGERIFKLHCILFPPRLLLKISIQNMAWISFSLCFSM